MRALRCRRQQHNAVPRDRRRVGHGDFATNTGGAPGQTEANPDRVVHSPAKHVRCQVLHAAPAIGQAARAAVAHRYVAAAVATVIKCARQSRGRPSLLRPLKQPKLPLFMLSKGPAMNASEDEQPNTPLSPWDALLAKHRLTPEQEARREINFQHFVREWTRDPWRAEQAATAGEEWLRACFNSAALAYDCPSDNPSSPDQDSRSRQTEVPPGQGD